LRLLKLANWLSKGDLDKYKQKAQQARQAEAKLLEIESEVESLRSNSQQSQKELAQTKAQLQINQGFQFELGETQLKLQKIVAESKNYQKQLFDTQTELQTSQAQLEQATTALSKSQNWIQQLKTPVQVIDIQKTLPKEDFETLWGFGIGTPKIETMATAGSLLIKGWVLGKKAKATIVRVMYLGENLLETPVEHPRPTVMQQYPDMPGANKSGFEFSLAVAGISAETKLELNAVLEDQSVVPLCAIVLKPQYAE
jgi:multidrug efflux pump subunit AcrA (membrane-fusion protein)